MPNDRRNAQDGPRSVARRDFVRSAALLAAGLAAAGRVDAATAGEPSQGAGRVREFIRKVQDARLFDLASVWDENSPIASVNPPYSMELNRTHAGTRGQFGDGGKLSFTSEVQHWSGQHGAPSWNAATPSSSGRDGDSTSARIQRSTRATSRPVRAWKARSS